MCCQVSLSMAPSAGWNVSIHWEWMKRSLEFMWILQILNTLCLLQMDETVSVLPEPDGYKVDLEHMLGIVGIVGTVLNLLVVVFVYVYTPVWHANAQPGLGWTYREAVDWTSSHLMMEGLQPHRRATGVCVCNYTNTIILRYPKGCLIQDYFNPIHTLWM